MDWWDPRFPDDPNAVQETCICQGCPTYDNCGENAAYCIALDTSRVIDTEIECHCPMCPVYLQQGFQHSFYCTRGNHFIRMGGPPD